MGVNLQYSRIAHSINLLPIRAVSYFDEYHNEGLHFFQLEAESSYRITPIHRNHFEGYVVAVGLKVEAKLYVANNVFNQYEYDLITRLDKLQNRNVYTRIILGDTEPTDTAWSNPPIEWQGHLDFPLQSNLHTKVMNATDKMVVDLGNNCGFSYEVESSEYRPRLIISHSGVIKSMSEIKFGQPKDFANRLFK